MPINRPLFEPGDIVQHFKREIISDKESMAFLYEIVGIAQHTETDEYLVIYRALYGDRKIYARPWEMFCSQVDKEKYPDIKQVHRFEKYKDQIFVE